ncbi:MAG: PKD domain-containing protein, partial [Candidatus Zixiibacteriota bacterium]
RELDECPFDADGDGFGDPGHPQNICPDDNCPLVYNPDQTDSDGDGAGDACDIGQVDVALSGDLGPYPNDTIYLTANHHFKLLLENDVLLGGMELGFQIYSPDGATWTWNDVGGYGPTGLGTGKACVTVVGGSRMDPPASVWDAGDLLVWEQDMDEISPDTVKIGGVAMNGGLPAGLSEHMLSIHFSALVTGDNDIGTICIDSSFIPPSGDWIFVNSTGTTTPPRIFGPYCWPVKELDLCPYDSDGDGFGDPGYAENYCPDDNCPTIANNDQSDLDGDGVGDVCDNCPDDPNPQQENSDGDDFGDACDKCPDVASDENNDTDNDGIGDDCDNCTDTDGDGKGNAGFPANTCDPDNCDAVANPDQEDSDGDGIGDECDTCTDTDGDGYGDPGYFRNTCPEDNCPDQYNPSQADSDNDGKGDACDPGFVGFTASPRCGLHPLTVQFTGGSPIIYPWLDSLRWDFGDGYTSTNADPEHTYDTTGTFDVILSYYENGFGDTTIKVNYIITQESITPVLDYSRQQGSKTVTFTASHPGAVVTSYLWDFDDGTTSTQRNPIHIYPYAGNFHVTLTVYFDVAGCSSQEASVSEDIIVNDLIADFSGTPTAGLDPLSVQFTDLSSGSPTSWLWEFGDGNTSAQQHPNHVYYSHGIYTVKLTVTNSLGSDDKTEGSYIHVDESYTDMLTTMVDFEARPGFDIHFLVYWGNMGVAPGDNCVIQIPLDPYLNVYDVWDLSVGHSSYSGYDIVGNTLILNLGTVEPTGYSWDYVRVFANLSEFTPIGYFLPFPIDISTSSVDINLDNNHWDHEIEVVGSIDPNDKLCDPEGKGDEKTIEPGNRLNYTILFENKPEATADAIYVRVIDTLDPNLDWNTLNIGGMSHPDDCDVEFDNNTGVINCFCDSIMLPPNHNPPEGEGYFTFSISPKEDIIPGTVIPNTAWIRFDYNAWLMAPETGPILRTIDFLYVCGDASGDQQVNLGDAVFIINHVFKGGPPPEPLEAGDANCDGNTDIGDAVYLVNHIFKGGSSPCALCD